MIDTRTPAIGPTQLRKGGDADRALSDLRSLVSRVSNFPMIEQWTLSV